MKGLVDGKRKWQVWLQQLNTTHSNFLQSYLRSTPQLHQTKNMDIKEISTQVISNELDEQYIGKDDFKFLEQI